CEYNQSGEDDSLNEKDKKSYRIWKKNFSGLYETKFELSPIENWREILPDFFPPGFIKLPDLVITNYHCVYFEGNYKITVIVKNIGTAASENDCLVYCNALSSVIHPGVNEIRLQDTEKVPQLNYKPPNNKIEIIFTFPLSKLFAKEVDSFEILVDAKGQVKELIETNNRVEFVWPY
ncbi:MAG: CARDB domain-containing protein, partial [Candidatus Heimdallarchaeota archaeon]